MDLIALLDRPVAYHAPLARLAGSVTAGVLLSQAIYWQRRCPEGRGGWWWHTRQKWEEETALGRHEQEAARRRLRELGIIEEERRGIPPRVWCRVREDRLAELLLGQKTQQKQDFAEIRQNNMPETGRSIGRKTATTRDYYREYQTDTPPPGGGGEIDDYLRLGRMFGGRAGKTPADPAGWEATVRRRLRSQGGLGAVDREQLTIWRRREDRQRRADEEAARRAAEPSTHRTPMAEAAARSGIAEAMLRISGGRPAAQPHTQETQEAPP